VPAARWTFCTAVSPWNARSVRYPRMFSSVKPATSPLSSTGSRPSGGAWRTLQGLADFAIVQSYLGTAAKWGRDELDALRELFTTGAWLPSALTPAE
jgi:hypothetical protein